MVYAMSCGNSMALTELMKRGATLNIESEVCVFTWNSIVKFNSCQFCLSSKYILSFSTLIFLCPFPEWIVKFDVGGKIDGDDRWKL